MSRQTGFTFFPLVIILLIGIIVISYLVWNKQTLQPISSDDNSNITLNNINEALSSAPEGFTWNDEVDLDGSLLKRCLKSKNGLEIPDGLLNKLNGTALPKEYWWTYRQTYIEGRTSNSTLEACISRINCPYGKIPGSENCINPHF